MKHHSYTLLFAWLFSTGLLITGCGPVLVGGAATGAAMVHDRRSAEIILDDQKIELDAFGLSDQYPELAAQTQISTTSYNHLVLLTGQAESVEASRRFASLVASIPKVKRVINEVQIGPKVSLSQQSRDSYLTGKVKTALFGIEKQDFDPARIKVISHQSVVYLMGIVTAQEAELTVEEVRTIGGVMKVVRVFEYVKT